MLSNRAIQELDEAIQSEKAQTGQRQCSFEVTPDNGRTYTVTISEGRAQQLQNRQESQQGNQQQGNQNQQYGQQGNIQQGQQGWFVGVRKLASGQQGSGQGF